MLYQFLLSVISIGAIPVPDRDAAIVGGSVGLVGLVGLSNIAGTEIAAKAKNAEAIIASVLAAPFGAFASMKLFFKDRCRVFNRNGDVDGCNRFRHCRWLKSNEIIDNTRWFNNTCAYDENKLTGVITLSLFNQTNAISNSSSVKV